MAKCVRGRGIEGVLRRAETVFADVRSICGERGVEFSFVHYGDYILGSGQWRSDRKILTSFAADWESHLTTKPMLYGVHGQ